MPKDSSFTVKTADASSGFLLWQVTTLWQREIKKGLEKENLSHSAFVILASLLWFREQDIETTQTTIINHTKLDKMTVSKSLKELVAKGFVNRSEHEKDTRAKMIILNEMGIQKAKIAVQIVEQIDEQFFSKIDPTEKKMINTLFIKLKNDPKTQESLISDMTIYTQPKEPSSDTMPISSMLKLNSVTPKFKKGNKLEESLLIAPCGMNCLICHAYLRSKNRCVGCRFLKANIPISIAKCKIRNCKPIKDNTIKFCFACDSFPCQSLKSLDKRYKTKYNMSEIDNLVQIRDIGIDTFLENEKIKWSCVKCGGVIDVHKQACSACKNALKVLENSKN